MKATTPTGTIHQQPVVDVDILRSQARLGQRGGLLRGATYPSPLERSVITPQDQVTLSELTLSCGEYAMGSLPPTKNQGQA